MTSSLVTSIQGTPIGPIASFAFSPLFYTGAATAQKKQRSAGRGTFLSENILATKVIRKLLLQELKKRRSFGDDSP